jgi:ABC-type glycerol-3-phosphate transport system permease component
MTGTAAGPDAAGTGVRTRPQRSAPRKGISPLAVVAILIGIALTAGPLYWMVVSSFKNRIEVVSLEPTIVPHDPTAENYTNLVTGGLPFGNFFLNSVLTAVLTAIVATVICTLAGYSFSRGNYRLRGPLSMSVLVVQMLPFVVLVGPLYLLMSSYNLLNTYVGLILGYTTFALPFGTWMMKGFIDAIPREIEEAARVDGYKRLGILVRVVVPLCLPGLATTATMIFIESWNNLLYPLVLMSQTEKLTLPPGLLQSFSGEFQFDWGGMMAATTVTSIPLVAAFFAVQRYMVHGMTAGALSGT